jgi:hypothetical protein
MSIGCGDILFRQQAVMWVMLLMMLGYLPVY